MANLFNTSINLIQLKEDNNFSKVQEDFITQIIEGNAQWNALQELATTIDVKQLKCLKTALEHEIGKTHYLSFQSPHWNYTYIKGLKNVLKDIQGALHHKNHLETYSIKKKEEYDKYAQRIDTIYKKTTRDYHGTIMLPVNQALEPRIGNSGGECFGYVAKWATSILKEERPFGLNLNQQNPLQPISFNSSLARKHPEINQFAVLTKEIASYQELQSSIEQLIEKLSSFKPRSAPQNADKAISYDQNSDFVFYKSPVEMAHSLISAAQKDSSKVYNLNVMKYLGGHALGFCLINNKYHFFDSNSGWYRFDTDKDFIEWFSFYYKQRGYESYYFNEFAISTYSLSSQPPQDENKKEKRKDLEWTPGTILLITILSPIIALYVISLLTNLFIIRGIRYLNIMVSSYFKESKEQPIINEAHIDSNSSQEPLSQNLEALDLAVNLKCSKSNSQKKKVIDYLDLHEGYKRPNSAAFFKEQKEMQSDTGSKEEEVHAMISTPN